MLIVVSQTELSTAVTDFFLGVECLFLMGYLNWRYRNETDNRRLIIWSWVLGLLCTASFLGALVHGIEMQDSLREILWKPLYLMLGVLVAMFLIAAINDLSGSDVARRLFPWSIAFGCVLFVLTELFSGLFLVFVIYEAVFMTAALGIYIYLSIKRGLCGGVPISAAIFINILAAGIQSSQLSFTLLTTFDHNGIFHLVQMLAIAILGFGLARSFENPLISTRT